MLKFKQLFILFISVPSFIALSTYYIVKFVFEKGFAKELMENESYRQFLIRESQWKIGAMNHIFWICFLLILSYNLFK